jgi:nucleoside-diphosphate-sugar epimerase
MIIKGEKYLITGGTGVVGQELCKRIIELGGKVIVLSRTEEKLNKLKEKYNQIEIVVSDILDDELVKKSIDDVRGVFHLTALAQGMQSDTLY